MDSKRIKISPLFEILLPLQREARSLATQYSRRRLMPFLRFLADISPIQSSLMRALNSAPITQRPTAVSPAPCHRMARQDLTSKLNYFIRSLREDIIAYRARVQDAPQEMERN